MKRLPKPRCHYGYTERQLKRYFTEQQWFSFGFWMQGQTGAICEGLSPCKAAHGFITYECDVKQFLRGGDTLD